MLPNQESDSIPVLGGLAKVVTHVLSSFTFLLLSAILTIVEKGLVISSSVSFLGHSDFMAKCIFKINYTLYLLLLGL